MLLLIELPKGRCICNKLKFFDDRVEDIIFGALPKDLKRSEFGKRSSPRNTLIAQLMLRVGYIGKNGNRNKKDEKLGYEKQN